MRCETCELTLNQCLRLCDARCLVPNDDVDFEQIKSIVDSEYYDKNLPSLNIFFQRKAAQMIKAMFSDERLLLVCIAVYKEKLSDKAIDLARTKSNKVDFAMECKDIKKLILSL